jgi:hypothetical protein
MRRSPATPLDERTALEVSRRDGGIPILITGRINRSGARYALEVVASRTSTGAAIVRASAEAADPDAVLDAVRHVAGRICTAVGDSARQVDADAKLESVTTPGVASSSPGTWVQRGNFRPSPGVRSAGAPDLECSPRISEERLTQCRARS